MKQAFLVTILLAARVCLNGGTKSPLRNTSKMMLNYSSSYNSNDTGHALSGKNTLRPIFELYNDTYTSMYDQPVNLTNIERTSANNTGDSVKFENITLALEQLINDATHPWEYGNFTMGKQERGNAAMPQAEAINATMQYGEPRNATVSHGDPRNNTTLHKESRNFTVSQSNLENVTAPYQDQLRAWLYQQSTENTGLYLSGDATRSTEDLRNTTRYHGQLKQNDTGTSKPTVEDTTRRNTIYMCSTGDNITVACKPHYSSGKY